MADVSMGNVDALGDNEGFPLEGAVDDSATHNFSEFQELSDELGEAAGFEETEAEDMLEGLPEGDPGIDSLAFEDQPEEPAEEKAGSSRAQKRIQSLANRNKQLEEHVQQQNYYFQQQLANMQQQMQQQSRSGNNDALSRQMEMQQQQLQMLSRQKEEESYSKLTPLEQLKVDILKEANTKSSSAAESQIAALREEMNSERAARAKQQEEADRRARYDYYNRQTSEATNQILLNGFEKDTVKNLSTDAEEMVLAMAGAYGIEPKDAAVRLKNYLDTYARAAMSVRSKTKGKKVRQGRAVPRPAAGGRRKATKGMGMPSLSQLRKAGFDSHIDWIAANEPAV